MENVVDIYRCHELENIVQTTLLTGFFFNCSTHMCVFYVCLCVKLSQCCKEYSCC